MKDKYYGNGSNNIDVMGFIAESLKSIKLRVGLLTGIC